MNSYLLLRDNKETGPHSLDEIIEMGLKKYDLIWVVNKSAAWRYASEIEEMKSFAPPVEEQPFDRFFRKPVQEEHYQLMARPAQSEEYQAGSKKEAEPIAKKTEPLIKRAAEKKTGQRKFVAISMPRNNTQPVKKPAEKPAAVVQQKPETAAPLTEPLLTPIFEDKKQTEALKQAPTVIPAPSTPAVTQQENSFEPLLQHIALGLAVLSLVVIGVLMTLSLTDDPLKLPVQQSVSKNIPSASDRVDQTPVQQEMQSIPVVSTSPQQSDPGQPAEAVAPAVKKQPVVRTNARKQVPPVVKAPAVAKPESLSGKVHVSLNDYKVNMLGGVDDILLTLNNTSSYTLDLVVVELDYIQSNHKRYKTETIRFRNIPPGSTASLAAPASNRGVRLNSRVTYITSSQAGVSENL